MYICTFVSKTLLQYLNFKAYISNT